MTAVLEDPLRAARMAVERGRFGEARALLDTLPPGVRRLPEWQLLAAMTRWRLGEFGPSQAAALQARDAYRAAGDTDGEMRAENVAAAGAFALGRLREAENGFARALELAERMDDLLMMARCANNLGNVAFYLGRHDAALAQYRLARARFHKINARHGETEALINMGLVFQDQGRAEDAREAADAALDLAEAIQSRRLVAQALAMRGDAVAAGGDAAVGRVLVDRALLLARAEQDQLAEIEALRLLGNIDRERGRLATARTHAEEALAVARQVGHPWAVATVLRDLAQTYRRSRKADRARDALREASRLLAAMGASERAEALAAKATLQ
ncbi:MAG TPA: tetratricopeptide repeat protein [Gemmatimonadales bacterium]|nr:tetratricopeptide repeat protein [Gemmatimonadales bacterium]